MKYKKERKKERKEKNRIWILNRLQIHATNLYQTWVHPPAAANCVFWKSAKDGHSTSSSQDTPTVTAHRSSVNDRASREVPATPPVGERGEWRGGGAKDEKQRKEKKEKNEANQSE